MTAPCPPLRYIPWPVRFVTLAAIWGMSFVFIKVGLESFAPLQVAALRLVLGGFTLLVLLAVTGDHLPKRRRTWLHLGFGALFMNVLPFTLFAYGEQHVSSVLAGIWNATTPLWTLPIAILMLAEERATWARVAGLLVGFCGVLVVLGVWNGLGEHDLLGDVLCLGAAACYGFGFPYARRFLALGSDSPVSLAGGQVLAGSIEASILAILFTSPPSSVSPDSVVAMVALGALGTGVAYILSWSIIRDAGATVMSTVTYALPIVAVAAGVLLLGEMLTWNEPVGAVIIVIGALLTQGRLGGFGRWLGARLRTRTMPK